MFSLTIIAGFLGRDPEVRKTPSGVSVTTLNVATDRSYTDKDGNVVEQTEWHRVVVWGKSADACGKYLKKGRGVLVMGENQTRSWEDDDGVKRFTTEIRATSVKFLPSGNGGSRPENQPGYKPAGAEETVDVPEDDIPF